MGLVLTDIQQTTIGFRAVSAAGNPVKVDSPQWNNSNPAVIDLTISADGTSVSAVTTGALGQARIALTVDADLGEGVKALTGLVDVEVVASEAVKLEITPGEVIDRMLAS